MDRAESALFAGDADKLDGLVDQLPKPDQNYLIRWATRLHDLEMLTVLVDDGRAPADSLLWLAISRGRHGTERAAGDVEVAEWLLDRGAKPCLQLNLEQRAEYGAPDVQTLAPQRSAELAAWYQDRC